jgi:Phage capsid family.
LIPGIVDIPTQRIWGVPVVINENVEAGKFYMGNFAEAGKIIERSGLQIEMARSGDDFERNLMTLRVERRLDFAVLQPKAMCYGTFAVS